ncbi:MAG: hypothetical protein KBC42_03780 [Candidatus Pacebacteria bacterium]|nr:hypothetical protein [Candidatus Paceibacterota bacterium]MBP9781012.1 hypothetical protein [Candidatus Paceibacterota bacterium]
MKTQTKRVDITYNPFLAVTSEDCLRQFYKGNSTRNTSDYVVVPEYDFNIISETKNSKKIIVFDEAESYGENIAKEAILKRFDWKTCCLWTGGSMELMIREDDPVYLDLILSPDREFIMTPNILRCTPFVFQILKHLEPLSSDARFSFVEVQTENLSISSFKALRGPLLIW